MSATGACIAIEGDTHISQLADHVIHIPIAAEFLLPIHAAVATFSHPQPSA